MRIRRAGPTGLVVALLIAGTTALAGAAAAAGTGAAAAGSATQRSRALPVVRPGQSVHLAGTDLYAEVQDTKQGVALYGERFPSGAREATGYFFVAQDGGIAVGALVGGAPRYVFTRAQPPARLSVAPSASGKGVRTVHLGWTGAIGGTALELVAGPDKSGEPALVSTLALASGPVAGSYMVGVTDRGVAVGRWQGSAPKLVYQVHNATLSAPSPVRPTTTTTTRPKGRGTSRSKTKVGTLGSTLTIGGIRATLIAVSDDAKPRTVYDALPQSSEAFDTATVRLTNLTSAPFVGASNAEIAIVGSDQKTYTPDIDYAVAGCEDFGSGGATGAFDIPPGGSETGCVHVVVPAGVRVALVGFSPGAHWVAGGYVAWEP